MTLDWKGNAMWEFIKRLIGIMPEQGDDDYADRTFTREQVDQMIEQEIRRLTVPSGVQAIVGDNVVPVYMPFVRFRAANAATITGCTLHESDQAWKDHKFPSPVTLNSGDRLIVHFPFHMEFPNGPIKS